MVVKWKKNNIHTSVPKDALLFFSNDVEHNKKTKRLSWIENKKVIATACFNMNLKSSTNHVFCKVLYAQHFGELYVDQISWHTTSDKNYKIIF